MFQYNANQNFDTTYRKIYVGGLPWTTREEGLSSFFEQFGEIIHVNVVYNRETRRSEGFGFVTFRDAESARRACEDPNPTIDGRVAKCNLAYLGARVHNNQTGQQLATYIPYWYPQDVPQHYPVYPYYPYPQFWFWTQHGPY